MHTHQSTESDIPQTMVGISFENSFRAQEFLLAANGLAAADKGARSLEDAQVKITAMVEEARGQARSILDQAQTRANGIVDEARVGATQERESILQSAQSEIDQQINRARDELRSQVAAITVAGAEKILAREIDPRAHQDLLDKLAAQI